MAHDQLIDRPSYIPAPVPPPQIVNLHSLIPHSGYIPAHFTYLNPTFPPQPEVFVPVIAAPVRLALNPAFLAQIDEQRTKSLFQFMVDERLVPSEEEEEKREDAICKLKQLVMQWIKIVARQHGFSRFQVANISATVLTYGSYGLGAHGPESDIDALCVGPYFATMAEDFFIVLHNMLQRRPEVSEIHCVKDAKVPLMRFKFNGISIDLPYARLGVPTVPDNIEEIIFCSFLRRGIDEYTWKSLSGVRANKFILQLVPDMEKFQSVLRLLKLWAKRRGVYCNLVGFFGGVHIMVLTAYVCQKHPYASITSILALFFETFALWPWPKPVMLEDGLLPLNGEVTETRSLMPIQLPSSPNELCHSNITRSTFHRIRVELHRGHALTRNILRPDFEWRCLFDPFPYVKKYSYFVRIFLAASSKDELGDWVGWVKSRFRSLLLRLEEEVQGLCDPNPTEYTDLGVPQSNVVFFWGIQPGLNSFVDIDSVTEYFTRHIYGGYQKPFGTFDLSIVDSYQLPKEAQVDCSSAKVLPKAYWRLSDFNQLEKPIYSQYLPNYSVGFEARNGDTIGFPSVIQ